MLKPTGTARTPPPKLAFWVQVLGTWADELIVNCEMETMIVNKIQIVFITINFWHYKTLNFFISSRITLGGISPLFIFLITSLATFAASAFVLKPSLPGKPGAPG